MKGNIKNKIILVLSLSTLIFFIFLINSYQNEAKQKKLFSQEVNRRIDLEAGVSALSKRNKNLEEKIKKLEELINKEKATSHAVQEELRGEILELEGKLQTMSKIKERLEQGYGEEK